jgi:trimethylamine:corrinoid methyltransferase-like protein
MWAATGESQTLSRANDKWHQTMKEEYDALMDNKTWSLVPSSTNKKSN